MNEEYLHALIVKYAEGTANDREVNLLTDWYRSSASGEIPWPASVSDEKELVYKRVLLRLRKETLVTKAPVRPLSWVRVAASFLIIGGAATIIYFAMPSSPTYVTITNPAGSIERVTLPDQSSVWLNAATTIQYEEDFANHRNVKLDGEAYFDVQHDAAHPFVIKTKEIENTVLGTTFNIEAYQTSPETVVTLITGKLRITNDAKQLAVLSPLQQITYDHDRGTSAVRNIDTAAILSWKNGTLDFQGKSLAEIAIKLERWFGIEIDLDPAISLCRYYLSFNNDVPLDEVLRSMAELSGIKFTIRQNKVTITGSACN